MLNPLLWAFIGWVIAVTGNAVAMVLIHVFPHEPAWHPLMHFDEIVTGVSFGVLRWIHGEWKIKIEQTYMSRVAEHQLRDALTILRYASSDEAKAEALSIVIAGLAGLKSVHEDFKDLIP